MKKFFKCAAIFFVVCALLDCKNEIDKRTEFVIGTVCTITIPKNGASRAVLDECFQKLKQLELILSANDSTSELSRLNATAANNPVTVSPELMNVLRTALHIAEITDGAFEPAIGKLVKLWNIGFENERVPQDDEIQNALQGLTHKNILLSDDKVFFASSTIAVDLGGIAKGYIADYLTEILKEKKVESAIVNLGGNVYVLGKKFFTDEEWAGGIRKPESTSDDYCYVLKVRNTSVVTSGIYERYFEANGVRYHHVLDAKTGYPVRNNLVSVSVVCESSMYADAFATAFLVMGYDRSMHFLKSFTEKNLSVVFIFDDGTISAYGEKEAAQKTQVQ